METGEYQRTEFQESIVNYLIAKSQDADRSHTTHTTVTTNTEVSKGEMNTNYTNNRVGPNL